MSSPFIYPSISHLFLSNLSFSPLLNSPFLFYFNGCSLLSLTPLVPCTLPQENSTRVSLHIFRQTFRMLQCSIKISEATQKIFIVSYVKFSALYISMLFVGWNVLRNSEILQMDLTLLISYMNWILQINQVPMSNTWHPAKVVDMCPILLVEPLWWNSTWHYHFLWILIAIKWLNEHKAQGLNSTT